ncbi:MAG TPA: hypothetical protein VGI12_01630 [Vicinamibacterales bacterium]|jgi:hypothetical protein
MRAQWIRIVLFAGVAAGIAAAGLDGLSQLGLTPEAAKEAIGSIITGGVNDPALPSKAFKMLPPAARAQAVTSAAGWVKAYAATPDFKKQYTQVRQSHRPEAPTWDTTPEQEQQKQDDEQNKQFAESTKALASLPAEQRKQIEEAIKGAAQAAAATNTPEMRKMRLDAIKQDRARQTKAYQDELAGWNRDYPDDPKPIIVKRLKEFLALSADVDFNARLKTQEGASTFENPAYQAKSSPWKVCYRAGKEATAAARTAAQTWLSELGG